MSSCIEWQGARTKQGYGQAKINGKVIYVHRRAMEEKLGRRLEPGEVVHHQCENPSCYNNDHLTTKDAGLHGHDHNRKISDEDVAFIRKLKGEDISYRDIEAITGWSRETARRWCVTATGTLTRPKGFTVVKRKLNAPHDLVRSPRSN